MRARDVAEDYPLVRLADDAMTAVLQVAHQRRPGVVVVDSDGQPVAVLPGSQVLRFVVPQYVQEDAALARVYDERTADMCLSRLAGRTVAELLPPGRDRLSQVSGDAMVMECAAVMARLHCPLVVVSDEGRIRGVVTAAYLLEELLAA